MTTIRELEQRIAALERRHPGMDNDDMQSALMRRIAMLEVKIAALEGRAWHQTHPTYAAPAPHPFGCICTQCRGTTWPWTPPVWCTSTVQEPTFYNPTPGNPPCGS